jgi:hypothetical protein
MWQIGIDQQDGPGRSKQATTYALGLDLTIDEGAGEASEELLGLSVALWLAILLAVLLVRLSSLL